MANLRNATLKEKLQDLDETLETSASDKTCAACGNVLSGTYVTSDDFVYCSDVCHEFKPPIDLSIEREFKLPVERVLDICVSNFTTVKTMCQALQLTPPSFHDVCKRHQIDISHLA
jgi:hypothetical protein